MDTPKSLNKLIHNGGGLLGASLLIAAALTSACGPLPCEKTLTCAPDDSSSGGGGMTGDGDGDGDGDGGDMGGAPGEDECQEADTRDGTTSCGINNRGAIEEICTEGTWEEGSICSDPDECEDDDEQNGSDSCGDQGVVVELCEEGEWIATSKCNEEPGCTGDEEQVGETACGLNGRGQLIQECLEHFWQNTDSCEDPDECVDGALQRAAACPGGDGSADDLCIDGLWSPKMCVLDDIYLASADSSGVPGGAQSIGASISATGRFLAFLSDSDNLVVGDTNDLADAFVHDIMTGEVTRVSVATSGVQGNGQTSTISVSGNGQVVAFRSTATNLASGNTNDVSQIFVHDRESGTTSLVSVSSDGTISNGNSSAPVLSHSGRFVAFSSVATNLVGSDGNPASDIFLHDRTSGTTIHVSVGLGGQEADDYAIGASLSADGALVAFYSAATNLVANDTNGVSDIFVYDVNAGGTQRVSVDEFGAQGDDASYSPAISSEGGHIAYVSDAANLVTTDTNAARDVFVYERATGQVTLASLNNLGAQAANCAPILRSSAISADGSRVVFYNSALGFHTTENDAQVFVHDLVSGQTRGVNRDATGDFGSPLNNSIAIDYSTAISSDGRFVVFESGFPHLPVDATNHFDVYVVPVWED